MDYSFSPLGDSACTVVFGDHIDKAINEDILAIFRSIQSRREAFIIDLVPAYASLTVFYDPVELLHSVEGNQNSFEIICNYLTNYLSQFPSVDRPAPRQHSIPVCYSGQFSTDLAAMAATLKLSTSELIRLHGERTYRVYMIGFQPGFAYMGEVDERIAFPRKEKPARRVAAGSVGIAGKQTGIYPFESPGGWSIIGRTPLKIFDKAAASPVLFEPGDLVTFYPITENEFANY